VIVDRADVPVYLRIAEKATHLRDLADCRGSLGLAASA